VTPDGLVCGRARPIAPEVSSYDPPEPPTDDADAEIEARLSARETADAVRFGTVVLVGLGLVMAAAVVAMLLVAW
jgi:hypothetical protein